MFDSSYPYKFRTIVRGGAADVFKLKEIYTFRGKSKQRYLIEVEYYPADLVAIKYYLKNHSKSANKFSAYSNLNEARPVLGTCLKLMEELYGKNPSISFVIIGANAVDELPNNSKSTPPDNSCEDLL
jgi:hypothetical protein